MSLRGSLLGPTEVPSARAERKERAGDPGCSGDWEWRAGRQAAGCPVSPLQESRLLRREGSTHRQDKIMLDLLQMAQREDKALWVPLTLPDQE